MLISLVCLLFVCTEVLGFHKFHSVGVRGLGKLTAELPIDEFDNFAREHQVLGR